MRPAFKNALGHSLAQSRPTPCDGLVVVAKQSPIRQATWLLVASIVLGLGTITVMFIGLSHANKPHEVRFAPLVAGLSIVNAVLCVRIIVMLLRAWRGRASNTLRWFHYLMALVCFIQIGFCMVLMTATVSELFSF